MKLSMNNIEFNLLRDFIEEEFGLSLKNQEREVLSKRLEPNLIKLKLKSYREYYNYLLSHPSSKTELNSLPSIIMNMESYFLREKAQFNVFIDLFNKIRKERAGKSNRTIRILSAGCSEGQEPYSISISIRNSGISIGGWDIRISGLDIDPVSIGKAREGIYNSYSLRGVEKNISGKFFSKTGSDHYRLNTDIIKTVDLLQGNILNPTVFKGLQNLDFIFCRNVLIYMGIKAKNRIALNLWEALSYNGYLFLGQSESFIKQDVLFRPAHFPDVIVYQKKNPHAAGTTD